MSTGRHKERYGGMCEEPRWRDTKRGKRCGQVCADESGRERYRFVPNAECEEGASEGTEDETSGWETFPEVMEFSGLKPMVEFKPVKLEPVPLLPLVGLTAGSQKRRGRSRTRED